jgi:hypothetical protein
MPYNELIKLKIMSTYDWIIPIRLLAFLVVLSAILSSQPVVLIIFASVFFGMGWTLHTLDFYNIYDTELTLVIFPDGRVNLISAYGDSVEGLLASQQWCTGKAAVLQVIIENKTRKLVILSAQQHTADEFRRLNMCLRQDFYNDTRDELVSGI